MDETLGRPRDPWAPLDQPLGTDDAVAVRRVEPNRRPTTYRVGNWIEHAGRRLRAPSVTGRVQAAEPVGRALERAGEYLEHRTPAEIRRDAERLIVRRPLASLAVALVAGYAAGRVMWR